MTDVLSDHDWTQLQQMLDALPAPCEPLDAVMLDGYLCALLLRPQPLPPARWWPPLLGVAAARLPALPPALGSLVQRRHAQLEAAIAARQWFDPCVFELDDMASASEPVVPWVVGFDIALQHFALPVDEQQVLEPLALLYRHLGDDALEDGQDELLHEIDMLEPPATLDDAVEELVRAVLLLADVVRPRPLRAGPAQRPLRAPRPAGAPRPPRGRK
jgi:uncharacterized protein